MRKAQQLSESPLLVILLTLSGGCMDAYSYLCRGHIFANAQTGNILLFGVNLSMGNFSVSLRYLVPVLAFTLGIAAAEIIRNHFTNTKHLHWRQAVLLTEAMLLLAVAQMPQAFNLPANSLTSFVCGAQVESFRKMNGSRIATTMCIGNLRAATQAICSYDSRTNKSAIKDGLLYLGIIGIFVIGAVIGNFSVNLWQEKAIIVSVMLLLTGSVFMFINNEK